MFGSVEEAIKQRLTEALEGVTVDTYSGEFTPEEIKKSLAKLPAVLIHLDDIIWLERSSTGDFTDMQFVLFLADRSARSQGDAKAGTYELIEDVRAALRQQTLGLNISGLKVEGVQSILQTKGLSIYAMRITTKGG